MSFDDLDAFSSLPRLSFNKIKPAKKIRSPADKYPCAVCAYLDPLENPLTSEYEPCTHRTRWQKTFKTKRSNCGLFLFGRYPLNRSHVFSKWLELPSIF
jgi:hypothetical protein